MNAERWQQVQRLFHTLLDLPSEAREAGLLELSDGDPEIERLLRQMLEADDEPTYLPAMSPTVVEEALRDHETPLKEGQHIGPWRVAEHIASGGMGSVYRAVRDDGEFEQTVAIKVMRSRFASERVASLFREERRVLARLNHENIARLFDGGTTGEGQPYFVMEFVDGQPLDRYCDHHALDVPARLLLFCDVLAAVDYAHHNLVVHRDLKPGNILVTSRRADDPATSGDEPPSAGRAVPKLLDFGVAKMLAVSGSDAEVEEREYGMTWHYASPEQREGGVVTTASDVYSLGVILSELIPLGDDSDRRRDLAAILAKACAERPEARYASARDFAEDLHRYLELRPVNARSPTAGYRLRMFVRRNRMLSAMATLSVLAVVLGAAFAGFWAIRADRSARGLAHETKRVHAVNDFLVEVLAGASPGELPRGATIEQALERAEGLIDEAITGDAEVESLIRSAIGFSYYSIGNPQAAIRHQQRAMELADRHTRGPSYTRASTRLPLARSLLDLGRYADARELAVAALDMTDALQDPTILESVRRLRSSLLSVLAMIAARHNDFGAALNLQQQALEITRNLTSASQARADQLLDMANLLIAAGDIARAEPLIRESFAIVSALHDEDHPTVLDRHATMARILHVAGQEEQARRLIETVLEAQRRRLGPQHPGVGRSLGLLAEIQLVLGESRSAVESARAALAIFDSSGGFYLPETAKTLDTLANALRDSDQVDEAIATYEQAIEVQRRIGGEDDLAAASFEYNLALILTRLGRFQHAEELLQRSVDTRLRSLGLNDPHTANALHGMAFLLAQRGDLDDALEWSRRCVAAWRAVDPPQPTAVSRALLSQARTELKAERLEAALEATREAAAVVEDLTPRPIDHTRAALFETDCLVRLERFEEAEGRLRELLESPPEDPATGASSRRHVLERMIELYERWERPEDAATLRGQLIETDERSPSEDH